MSLTTRIQWIEVQAGKVAPVGNELEGTPFVFPVPTPEQLIAWLDSERIPEYIAACNGGWAHNERGYYPSKEAVESRLAWCHDMLGNLQSAYERGEIDADTYSRLTTPQNYDDDHLRALRRQAEYFRPCSLMLLSPRSNGREVSIWTLRTGPGDRDRITIWLIGNEWRQFAIDKPYEQPGW